MMNKGLITICVRGGSKGIPGKNIKPLSEKPLIYYTSKIAEEFKKNKDVDIYLSTDSEEIKNVVNNLGFNKIKTDYVRPKTLATDIAGKLDVIKDVKIFAESSLNKKYDYVLDLDVTSPLRSIEDLEKAYKLLFESEQALNIFSVSPANRNPYFNMVEESEDGFYKLSKQAEFLTRQSAPKVYDMNASFYIYKKEFFEEKNRSVITNKSLIYEISHICFDLDHPIDFEFMSFLLENDKLDFDFIR